MLRGEKGNKHLYLQIAKYPLALGYPKVHVYTPISTPPYPAVGVKSVQRRKVSRL